MKRRAFLKWAAFGGASLLLPLRRAWPYSQSPTRLRKFIQPLPGLGPTGVPVATPNTTRFPGVDYYELSLGQFKQQLHPDLPAETTLWGYADVTFGQQPNRRYLGGVIVAHRRRPVRLTAINELPSTHPLPFDTTIPDTAGGQNRATIHLHGGLVPWTSDGGPFSWFAPDGTHGPSFLNPGPKPGTASYYYPNDQSARLLWYHDHAVGQTRLNAYAGLASGYILRDELEEALIRVGIIPSRELPLAIQDKTFVDGRDENYTFGAAGDLWYPYRYEPESATTGRWAYGPDETPSGKISGPLPVPSVVPEFFGDTTLVNGAVFPFAEVERRRYRFRIINGSQARFLNLQLYYATSSGDEADLTRPGPAMLQIGTEGGFLPVPVLLNHPPQPIGFDDDPKSPTFGNVNRYTLLMGPGERADVIIDFSRVPSGARLILYSDAPSPFPTGDPRNDYFTGDPDLESIGGAPSTMAGFGPNTRTLLQFRVVPARGFADAEASVDLFKIAAAHDAAAAAKVMPVEAHDRDRDRGHHVRPSVRDLTLTEDFDELGRLVQRLGTNVANGLNTQGLPTFGRNYADATTETVRARSTEIWRIFNLTGDTHPIHFHLVNVEVVSRQPFDASNYNGTPVFTGPARGPDANERGFKETVRMNPNECTTVKMTFELPRVPFVVPPSPRTGGFEYVWHCHILEHEEHDMMRPLVVQP